MNKAHDKSMEDTIETYPDRFKEILDDTNSTGFNQLSDSKTGSLLATLSATKPNGCFLELGTGTGLSTSWLLQGMDKSSTIISVDEDDKLIKIAKKYLDSDPRVTFITGKGEETILNTKQNSIDFIFADTWPGKYNHLEETLTLLKHGGLYIIDDMLPQDNWPDGHSEKSASLIKYLENRNDIQLTKIYWSTGIIVCTKKNNNSCADKSVHARTMLNKKLGRLAQRYTNNQQISRIN